MVKSLYYVFSYGELVAIKLDEKQALNVMDELYYLDQYSSPHIEEVEYSFDENIKLFDSKKFNELYPDWDVLNPETNKYDSLPLGLYIIVENKKFVSIYNLDGFAWTEEHAEFETAVRELKEV